MQTLNKAEVEKIIEACENLSGEFLKIKIDGKRLKPLLLVYNNYRETCKICGGKVRFYMQQPIKRKTLSALTVKGKWRVG